MTNMLKFLRCLPGVADADWERRTSNSSLGKLLFRNGMLDATSGVFFPRDQYPFNPDIVFFARLDMEYELLSKVDRGYAHSIRQRIFATHPPPLGEEAGQHMLLQLSRGLMGDCMKRFFLLGLGAANPSLLRLSSLHDAGIMQVPLMPKVFPCSSMAAMRHRLCVGCFHRYNKRLLFSNEVRSDGGSSSSKKQRPQVYVDGNMLKKLSSGGNAITGRFHGGNETAFVFHGLATCFANDFPTIDPCDEAVSRRLQIFSFNKQFVVAHPSNELQLLLDRNIKAEIDTPRFRRCLLMLMCDVYNSARLSGLLEQALELFDLTNDARHFETSTDIEYAVAPYVSFRVFTSELKRYAQLNQLSVIDACKRRGADRVERRCWKGLRFKSRIDEEDDEAESTTCRIPGV
jgi:hypothetical protein